VQQLLHQLNGFKGEDIEKMRCCLRELYKSSKKPVVQGYALHALSDTYGHMVAETVGGVAGAHSSLYTGRTLDEMYKGPYGHGFDFTFPDRVSLRPDLAESYLRDLYSLVGANRVDADTVVDYMRIKLNPKGTSGEKANSNWRMHVTENSGTDFPAYAKDWDPAGKERLVSTRTVHNMTDWLFDDEYLGPLMKCLRLSGVDWPVP
jgi:hypothetical protein